MSYILDALRRADAERERGSVPSLHAQSVLPGSPEQSARRGVHPMTWIVAGLSLALAASLAWHFLSRDAARDGAPVATETAAIAGATPMVAPTTTPAPPTPTTQPSPAQAVALPPVPAARPAPAPMPSAMPAAPVATATRTAPANAASPGVSPPSPNGTPAAATPATPTAVNGSTVTPPAPAANTRLPTQDELPEDIRRQLPKFSVGGSIYSESAASRFLILNGQIFHENDKVMPELVLEQIKLKSAVLRYRNQRFTIAY